MIITIQVSLPMTDAQGVKESVAARLEDMGVVHVTDIRDDGYGKQESFLMNDRKGKEEETQDDAFPEAMEMIRKMKREGKIAGG